jgi:beta-catenin-like protein 1
LTLPALRRQLGKFERIVAKNAEQRGKFPDDPSKSVYWYHHKPTADWHIYRFIESESDLDGSVKHLLPLTQNPALFYPELVKSGAVSLLCNLLSHENTDIAVDVIEVIRELTDEDVGAEEEDLEEGGEDGDGTKVRMAMADFIDELVSSPSFAGILFELNGQLAAQQLTPCTTHFEHQTSTRE